MRKGEKKAPSQRQLRVGEEMQRKFGIDSEFDSAPDPSCSHAHRFELSEGETGLGRCFDGASPRAGIPHNGRATARALCSTAS